MVPYEDAFTYLPSFWIFNDVARYVFVGWMFFLHKEEKYRKYISPENHCTIVSLETSAVGLVLLQTEFEIVLPVYLLTCIQLDPVKCS